MTLPHRVILSSQVFTFALHARNPTAFKKSSLVHTEQHFIPVQGNSAALGTIRKEPVARLIGDDGGGGKRKIII